MKPIFHYKAWLVGVCFINAKSLDKEKKSVFLKAIQFHFIYYLWAISQIKSNRLSISGKDYYTFKRSQSCYQYALANLLSKHELDVKKCL